jgi:predicted unusual protein kinase regulating ubiquinone biosynthesis (AarF/ABC1/UbiB family)
VHRATLHSGEQVVVKVQRPGLRQLFDIDLENLEKIAVQLDKQDEATQDFKGIYQVGGWAGGRAAVAAVACLFCLL